LRRINNLAYFAAASVAQIKKNKFGNTDIKTDKKIVEEFLGKKMGKIKSK